MHYTQCELIRKYGTKKFCQVVWIPSKLAKVGKKIRIKRGDHWDTGWVVENIYMTDVVEAVEDRAQDYKRTRKASDI